MDSFKLRSLCPERMRKKCVFKLFFKKRKKQEYPEENFLMYKRSFKTRTIIFPISAHVVSIPFAKEVLMTLHAY